MTFRNTFRIWFPRLLAIGLIAAALGVGNSYVRGAQKGLAGSWIQTGEGPGLTAIFTFNTDGTVTGTNANHLSVSPQHGVWQQNGSRNFEFIWWALRFGEEKTLIGRTKIKGQITLSEDLDEYTIAVKRDFLDLQDQVVDSGSGTGHGKRIVLESFN